MSARLYLYRKQRGKCHYCRKQMTKRPVGPFHATEDHIIPRCEGGGNYYTNLVGACFTCNNMRGNIPYMAFREFIDIHGNGQSIAEVLRGLTPAQYEYRKSLYDTVRTHWGGKLKAVRHEEEKTKPKEVAVKLPDAKQNRRSYLHMTRKNIESIIIGVPRTAIERYQSEGFGNA